MPKKHKKDKKPLVPKGNRQIPNSSIKPMKILGPRYYLQHAREYPIFGCWVMEGWREEGITPVVVARRQDEDEDKVMFTVCLVDLYCLGIKDAYANADVSLKKFQSNLPNMCSQSPEPCSVELAHEIIYGGMEYAEKYGLKPHADFAAQFCDQVLDPPETHPRTNNVAFGKDGKPLFVSGPYDDNLKISTVMSALTRTAGEGNFNYVAGDGGFDFDEADFPENEDGV